jgi:hypothetical protein
MKQVRVKFGGWQGQEEVNNHGDKLDKLSTESTGPSQRRHGTLRSAELEG